MSGEPSPYTLKQRLALSTLPPAAALAVRALARSWRLRLDVDPDADPRQASPRIYALWHESTLTVTAQWRDHRIQPLTSLSFDGELIAALMLRLGYAGVSRGSSSRGGAEALRSQAAALAAGRHVAITVDGPRGPARRIKPGVLHLALSSRVPVVVVSCAARPDWRLRSWDRTQLPPPLARLAFVMSPPLDPESLEGPHGLDRLYRAFEAGGARAAELLG